MQEDDSDAEDAKRSLGSAIKAARKARGWTQTELGELIGKDQSAVSAWEIGQNAPSGLDVLALQRILGVSFGTEVVTAETSLRIAEAAGRFRALADMAGGMATAAVRYADELSGPAMPRASAEDAEAGRAGLEEAEAPDAAPRYRGRSRGG